MPRADEFDLASGFGIPIDSNGLAVTAASAVLGADRINVLVPGAEFPVEAMLEARAECHDLALIDVGESLGNAVNLAIESGPAVWSVAILDGEPIVAPFGEATVRPHLNLDARGNVVSMVGLTGAVGSSSITDTVTSMRRRDLVSQLGYLVTPLDNDLQVVAVESPDTTNLMVGDRLVSVGGGAATLDRLCSSAEPVLLVERDGREWEGVVGGVPLVLTSARTIEEIRQATVRMDVDVDGDGSVDRRGSGFFVSESGLAVTNHHVVSGASGTGSVEVVFDGAIDSLPASIVGRSSCSDLALIKVSGTGFTHLVWSPDSPMLGDPVRSVGYPDGTDFLTVKSGVVSKTTVDESLFAGLLPAFEHSAETIPGSSGGPVVNELGEVIGIVFAARPVDFADTVVREELAIGVPGVADVAAELTFGDFNHLGMNLHSQSGLLFVADVDPGSPAEEAGFQARDWLTSVDGQEPDADGLGEARLCQRVLAGDEVRVEVSRFVDGVETRFEGALNGPALERVPDPFVQRDPSGLVSGMVPGRWTDYQGIEPAGDVDFIGFRAAPSVDAFLNEGFGAHPGLRAMVSWSLGDAGTPLERLQMIEYSQCADEGISGFEIEEYHGYVRRWTECQGTDSVLLDFALTDTLQPPLMVVITIIAPADEIDEIADRFLTTWSVPFLERPAP